MNLRAIPHLAEDSTLPSGISEHRLAIALPVKTVALGSWIIEKQFVINRSYGGSDRVFLAEPVEFGTMVYAVRVGEEALGKLNPETSRKEGSSRFLQRSLFVLEELRAGKEFHRANVRSTRPGNGLRFRELTPLSGQKSRRQSGRGNKRSGKNFS